MAELLTALLSADLSPTPFCLQNHKINIHLLVAVQIKFSVPKATVMMQSSQGGDPSQEPWLGDSKKIGPEMQEKVLGFSGALG